MPKQIYTGNELFERRSNVELLSHCINNQKDMQILDLDGIYLSNNAAKNLLELYFCSITKMNSIPSELFRNNTFLQSDENVDLLCECIVK